jgi:AraC-like DNA-binding protein
MARDIVTRIYIPHELSTRNRRPLNFKLKHLESERFTIGHCAYGADADLWVPPMGDCYHINLTLDGHTMVSQGGVDAHTDGRTSGVIFGPLDPFTVRWSPEAVQYAVKIPRISLEMHLGRLLNRSIHDPVDFGLSFDLSSGAGQALLATVTFLRNELHRPGGISTMPVARDQLESTILTQILMTIPNAFSACLLAPERAASHRIVQAAIELIQAHPEQNPTVVELAEAVGATPRGLQRGFKEAVGTSPAAYMREVRLDRVRDELVVGAGADNVTDVAMRWGFFHLGRFSQQYRQRFGHLPSETLRRARQGATY